MAGRARGTDPKLTGLAGDRQPGHGEQMPRHPQQRLECQDSLENAAVLQDCLWATQRPEESGGMRNIDGSLRFVSISLDMFELVW